MVGLCAAAVELLDKSIFWPGMLRWIGRYGELERLSARYWKICNERICTYHCEPLFISTNVNSFSRVLYTPRHPWMDVGENIRIELAIQGSIFCNHTPSRLLVLCSI
jgi:hypothetical protein